MGAVIYEDKRFQRGEKPQLAQEKKQFFDSITVKMADAHHYNVCPVISYHTMCSGVVNSLNEILSYIRIKSVPDDAHESGNASMKTGIGYLMGMIYSVKAVKIELTFQNDETVLCHKEQPLYENRDSKMRKLYDWCKTNHIPRLQKYMDMISNIETNFQKMRDGVPEGEVLPEIADEACILLECLNSDKSNLRIFNYVDNRKTGSGYDMEDYDIINENDVMKIDVSKEMEVSVRVTNLLQWTLISDDESALYEDGACYLFGVTGGRGFFVPTAQEPIFVSALVPQPRLGMKIKYRDFFWEENREIEFAL